MWEVKINFFLQGFFILFSIIIWKKIKTINKIVFFYVAVTMIIEFFAFMMMLNGKNNLVLFHVLTPVQILLQMTFFYNATWSARLKFFFLISTIGLVGLTLLSIIFRGNLHDYNSYSMVFKSCIITISALLFIYDFFLSHKNIIIKFQNKASFWITIGFLTQALSTFFFEAVMNHLIRNNIAASLTFYFINVSVGFLLYLLLIQGMIVTILKEQKK